MRDSLMLVQPLRRTTNYGLRTFSYVGSKLWNDLSITLKDLDNDDVENFKINLKTWNGPNYENIQSFYV